MENWRRKELHRLLNEMRELKYTDDSEQWKLLSAIDKTDHILFEYMAFTGHKLILNEYLKTRSALYDKIQP